MASYFCGPEELVAFFEWRGSVRASAPKLVDMVMITEKKVANSLLTPISEASINLVLDLKRSAERQICAASPRSRIGV